MPTQWYTVARLSDRMEWTPEGFLLCKDVPIARCGTQLYRQGEIMDLDANDDGWIEIDRQPSEVFKSESMASFQGKPIVNDHPDEMVNPSNYTDLALGHISNPRRGENTDHDLLLADLLFTTDKGIDLVRQGKRALSVGYNAYYERTGRGLGRQKDIICNHVALVDEGRCGARCTIMDGKAVYNPEFDDAFSESEHPRGNKGSSKGGQFVAKGQEGSGTTSAPKAAASSVKSLAKAKERAFTGKQVATKTKLSKQESGAIGEAIITQYLKQHGGLKDAKPLNTHTSNFPVDLIGDHELIEVKTGLVSNSPSAQKWRATIGQPSKAEQAWLAKASPEAKAAWNQKKMKAIMDRKMAVVREYEKKLGKKIKPRTLTTILNHDTRTADVYSYEGFHHHIRWNNDEAKKAYVGSYKY